MKKGAEIMYADAVIEGGGVKGIALVGAICEAEKRGYKWKRLAGTSAGAIIASLLAAGYTAEELKKELVVLDYKQFAKEKGLGRIPVVGTALNMWTKLGIFNSDSLEEWIRVKLLAKGVRTFADLKRPLYIIASDITAGQMLIMPDDLKKYGIDPAHFEIAKAVRMSSSIPYYFQPVKLKMQGEKKGNSHYIVDGGLLSNFPVWIFDYEHIPKWPTFGFRLVSEKTGQPHQIKTPFSLSKALVSTMLEAHDLLHIKEEDYVRSILVPTHGIKSTDFNITEKQSDLLFNSGVESATKFFEQWNFIQYTSKYYVKKNII